MLSNSPDLVSKFKNQKNEKDKSNIIIGKQMKTQQKKANPKIQKQTQPIQN